MKITNSDFINYIITKFINGKLGLKSEVRYVDTVIEDDKNMPENVVVDVAFTISVPKKDIERLIFDSIKKPFTKEK